MTLEQQANIAKAEAILRTALVMPVTEYQLQNREWAKGVLADAWMAGARAAQQQQRELVAKWRASAESSIRIIAASNMPETFPTAQATAEALSAAADELDSILKGTP